MAATGDTGEQQGEIYNSIVAISEVTFVDARLILAVIMQEVGDFLPRSTRLHPYSPGRPSVYWKCQCSLHKRLQLWSHGKNFDGSVGRQFTIQRS